jgi:hypothetical protein
MASLNQYLEDQHHAGSTWWLYRFPSGRTASVIPDPRPEHPFRFEVQVGDEEPRHGLASADVEDLLNALALAAPAPEPVMALVTVDEMGRLTPDSTLTIGEDTWPVPERTGLAGYFAPVRVSEALREHGWRRVVNAGNDYSQDGVIGFPVELIEAKEEQ